MKSLWQYIEKNSCLRLKFNDGSEIVCKFLDCNETHVVYEINNMPIMKPMDMIVSYEVIANVDKQELAEEYITDNSQNEKEEVCNNSAYKKSQGVDLEMKMEELNTTYKALITNFRYAEAEELIKQQEQFLSSDDRYRYLEQEIEKFIKRLSDKKNQIPKSDSSYAKAKKAYLIEENYDKMSRYFEECIQNQEEHWENAIIDYIQIYSSIDLERSAKIADIYGESNYIATGFHRAKLNDLLVEIYEKNNDFKKAIKYINRIIYNLEKNKKLFGKQKKGLLYFKQGNLYLKSAHGYDKAIVAFEKAIENNYPELITCKRNLALSHYGLGDIQTAIDILKDMTEKYSSSELKLILNQILNFKDISILLKSIYSTDNTMLKEEESSNIETFDNFIDFDKKYKYLIDNFEYYPALYLVDRHKEIFFNNENYTAIKNEIYGFIDNFKKFNSLISKQNDDYTKAKKAYFIEKNYEKMSKYFERCIQKRGNRWMSAIKDYMQIYSSIDSSKGAELADKYKSEKYFQGSERVSLNNLLSGIYEKNNDFQKALDCTNDLIEQVENNAKLRQKQNMGVIYFRQGNLYLKLAEYDKALEAFNKATEANYPGKVACERSVALCYIGLGNTQKAKELLKEIVEKYDDEASELILQQDLNDKNIILDNIDNATRDLDQFIQFYLDSCEFIGTKKTKDDSFSKHDFYEIVRNSEKCQWREKADRLLTSVVVAIREDFEDIDIYPHLFNSLRLRGLSYLERKNYDIAKNFMLSALMICETKLNQNKDYIDLLVKNYLESLNEDFINDRNESISEYIKRLIYNKEKAKIGLINLSFYSKNQFNALIKEMQEIDELKDICKNLTINNYKKQKENLEVNIQILKNKEIDDKSIFGIFDEINTEILFDSDKSYVETIKNIFKDLLEIKDVESFELKENILLASEIKLGNLLSSIETNPTIFSINNLRNLLQDTKDKIYKYKNDLKKSSLAKLIIEPIYKDNEYTKQDGNIEFSLSLRNEQNLSPAKDVCIYVNKNLILKIPNLASGNEKTISTLIATDEDIFVVKVKVEYKNALEEIETIEKEITINLENLSEFEEIQNPYTPNGDIVKNKNMVFGREGLIDKLIQMINNNTIKGVILYGQKRTGKSTVFHYLQEKLNNNSNYFCINFSAGETPKFDDFVYKIVKEIYKCYRKIYSENIYDLIDDIDRNNIIGLTGLVDFLEQVDEILSKKGRKLLILIDEFTYIYNSIKRGDYSEDFLKHWKALIQKDLFKSALIGQNSMPFFIKEYPNELAVYKQEKISYLDKESSYQLMDKPILMKNSQSRYKGEAMDLIYKYTNGSPYYIQKICFELVEYINAKKSNYITTADVNNVVDAMLSSMNDVDFDNLMTIGDGKNEESDKLKEVLTIIANETRHISSVSYDNINIENKDEFLKILVDTGVVQVENKRYSIVVELLSKYLQKYY